MLVFGKCERNDSGRADLRLFIGTVIGKVRVRASELGNSEGVLGSHFA